MALAASDSNLRLAQVDRIDGLTSDNNLIRHNLLQMFNTLTATKRDFRSIIDQANDILFPEHDSSIKEPHTRAITQALARPKQEQKSMLEDILQVHAAAEHSQYFSEMSLIMNRMCRSIRERFASVEHCEWRELTRLTHQGDEVSAIAIMAEHSAHSPDMNSLVNLRASLNDLEAERIELLFAANRIQQHVEVLRTDMENVAQWYRKMVRKHIVEKQESGSLHHLVGQARGRWWHSVAVSSSRSSSCSSSHCFKAKGQLKTSLKTPRGCSGQAEEQLGDHGSHVD